MIAAVEDGGSRIALDTRRGRRLLNWAGVAAVVGLMAYALYQEHVVGLEVCPLCVFQRVVMVALGAVFLAAALHAPVGKAARAYAGVGLVTALIGIGISGWHVRMQNLPPEAVPACGPGLNYYFDTFPMLEALSYVFTASGECAEINWSFLGLSMPAWVLIWFVLLGALVTAANWKRLAA